MNKTVFSILSFVLGIIIGLIIISITNYLKNKKTEKKADSIIASAKKEDEKIKRERIFENKEEINKVKLDDEKEKKKKKKEIKKI